jgi:hypothetical protein
MTGPIPLSGHLDRIYYPPKVYKGYRAGVGEAVESLPGAVRGVGEAAIAQDREILDFQVD